MVKSLDPHTAPTSAYAVSAMSAAVYSRAVDSDAACKLLQWHAFQSRDKVEAIQCLALSAACEDAGPDKQGPCLQEAMKRWNMMLLLAAEGAATDLIADETIFQLIQLNLFCQKPWHLLPILQVCSLALVPCRTLNHVWTSASRVSCAANPRLGSAHPGQQATCLI